MKGRGAQSQVSNPYERMVRVQLPIITDYEPEVQVKTSYQKVQAKTIVTKVDSPDLNFNYSLNPYQGCEHGCSYCYARTDSCVLGIQCWFGF